MVLNLSYLAAGRFNAPDSSAYRGEATAVDGARAMLLESGKVGGGAVAFVLGETVCGPLFVVLKHESVPSDLGEDAGGGDAKTLGVALDDSGLRRGERGHGATVYQRVRRGRCELGKSGVHRSIGGLEDVDLVDEHSVYDADAKLNFCFRVNGTKKLLADFFSKLLGVVETLKEFREAFGDPFSRQYRRRRHNRPGERPAPGFVYTSQTRKAARMMFALEMESLHPQVVADRIRIENGKIFAELFAFLDGHGAFANPLAKVV